MKHRNITIVILILLLLSACNSSKIEAQKVQQKVVQETKYYTFAEYKHKYEKNLLRENDPTYFGLTINHLKFLNNKFQKATKQEI